MSTFIEAQIPTVPAIPHTTPQAMGDLATAQPSPSSSTQYTSASASQLPPVGTPGQQHHSLQSNPPSTGLRHACFWVAFRQEICSAFLKQRDFKLPLERCQSFRSFEAANDAVWADRLVIFCADVLQFCYGDGAASAAGESAGSGGFARAGQNLGSSRERWLELRRAEATWLQVLPSSFDPIFYREADDEHVFPEIWYLTDHHVAGIQHLELARILLAVYDPSVPKLGPGHRLAQATLSRELRAIVKRLCGIAVSNRRSPPGLITAALGIAMCGERFDDRREQEALLEILFEIEREHAWPTESVVSELRTAWGW